MVLEQEVSVGRGFRHLEWIILGSSLVGFLCLSPFSNGLWSRGCCVFGAEGLEKFLEDVSVPPECCFCVVFLNRRIEVRGGILTGLSGYQMGAFAGCYHDMQRRMGLLDLIVDS